MKLSRRIVLKGLAVGGGQILGMPSIVKAQDAIRLGVLGIATGPIAAFGIQMQQGISLYLRERKNLIEGRPVELVIYDTQGQPPTAVSQAAKLIFEDKVQFLLGPVTSTEAFAVSSFLTDKQIQIPSFGISVAGELTQRRSNPWFLRISSTASQSTYPLADFAAKELRYRTIAIVADDSPLGYEISGGFQRVFEDAGGRITQRIWVPPGAQDYTANLQQFGSKADAIFVGLPGVRGLSFIQQARRFGTKLPVLANFTNTDPSALGASSGTFLEQFGEDIFGTISSSWYLPELETSTNHIFTTSMRREFGTSPGLNAAAAYTCGAVLEQALKVLKGDIENKSRFMEALRGSELPDTVRGPITFDERGNVICNIYIAKTVRAVRSDSTALTNALVRTYPAVSQFWTFNPAAFLSSPAFSRDYPPAHFLER